jgi:N-acetylmuramoyl-L-alanine amidase
MKHTVADGDCIESIACQYGLEESSAIWDDPGNATLKDLRGDGSQLHPGDVVCIPPLKPKEYTLSTGQRHKLVVKRPKRLIRVRFLDSDGSPMSGDYVLKAGTLERKGSLDGEGVLEQKLPADITQAEVTIGELTRTILIGHLNPLEDTDDEGLSGAQARLLNLGYYTGKVDGEMGPRTQAALRAFQEAHKLEVTGELDDETTKKLVEEHGC